MIQPEDRIGHIRIDGRLAEGGMGAVFVGFDEKLQREVVLKAIRSDRLDVRTRARFLTEARVLSQLDHPNICRIHGYLESGRGEFLVLERIRGRTLRQALREGIDPAAKLAIAEALARALEAAHEKGIVHRDLKPDNVMLSEEVMVKVLDFGLARPEAGSGDWGAMTEEAAPPVTAGSSWWLSGSSESGGLGRLLGTPAGMSPEQARGEPATAASDVYSLGLLLQELFTGRPPYEDGLSESLLLVKAADGDTLPVEGVGDPDLAHLIRRLKALAPEARPTAADTAERLAWIRGKPRRRRRWLLAAGLATVFLLGGTKYTLDLQREERLAFAALEEAKQEAARADAAARFLEELFRASDPRQAQGDLPTSRELLRRGTERLDKELHDQPLLRARLLDTLGRIHSELGLYDESRPLLEEALKIREATLPDDHPDLAGSREALAVMLRSRGEAAEAVRLLERVAAVGEKVYGPEHPELARILMNLGRARADLGQHAEARKLLERSLTIAEKTLAPEHPQRTLAQKTLAEHRRDHPGTIP